LKVNWNGRVSQDLINCVTSDFADTDWLYENIKFYKDFDEYYVYVHQQRERKDLINDQKIYESNKKTFLRYNSMSFVPSKIHGRHGTAWVLGTNEYKNFRWKSHSHPEVIDEFRNSSTCIKIMRELKLKRITKK